MPDTALRGIRVEPPDPTPRKAAYSTEYVGQLRTQLHDQGRKVVDLAVLTDHMAGLAADAVQWIDRGRPDIAKATLGRLLLEYGR